MLVGPRCLLFVCWWVVLTAPVFGWLPTLKVYSGVQQDEGRSLATLLGYPEKCEKNGILHSCTLSFACWLVGGSSESGCTSSSWIITCCVIDRKTKKQKDNYHDYFEEYHWNEADYEQELRIDSIPLPVIQKRNDLIEDKCGLSVDRILAKRIIGGSEAKFGEFPWQAYIKILAYQCGGVLVSRKYVATAAHCVVRAKIRDILVILGELDTLDLGYVKEYASAEFHKVRKKVIHPNFAFRATQPDRYDIALLELKTPAAISYHIMPICLPKNYHQIYGKQAVIAGWGKEQTSKEITGSNVLRRATVPILDIHVCALWHKTKQIRVELHEEMLCAGHEDGHQDACLGDSGGPLIVLIDGRWTLAGITSAGFGCGEPHQPGIYHSVPHSSEWIRSVIREN